MSTGSVVDAPAIVPRTVIRCGAFGGVGRDGDVERDLRRLRAVGFDPVDGEAAAAQDRSPAGRDAADRQGDASGLLGRDRDLEARRSSPGATAMAGYGVVSVTSFARRRTWPGPPPASRVPRSRPTRPTSPMRDRTSETLDTTDTGHLLCVDHMASAAGTAGSWARVSPRAGRRGVCGLNGGEFNQASVERPESSASHGDRTAG